MTNFLNLALLLNRPILNVPLGTPMVALNRKSTNFEKIVSQKIRNYLMELVLETLLADSRPILNQQRQHDALYMKI